MASPITVLKLLVTGDTKAARRELDKLAKQARGVGAKINRGFLVAKNAIGSLQGVIAAVGFGALVKSLVGIGDQYALLAGRIGLVTASQKEAKQVTEELFRIAQRTRTEFSGVANLYIKVAQSADELNASQEQLLTFTEGVGNALTVSGSGAQEAAGALQQLSQSMAGSIVQAEEFNSIMDGAPEILRAVARQLPGINGSLGKLRKEVIAQKVTSREFFEAFLRDTENLKRQAQGLPLTVGQALTQLGNTVERSLSQADFSPVVQSIQELGEVLSDPEVQEGMVDLAEAVLIAAGKLVTAGTKIVQASQGLGIFFASVATGVEDPNDRLEVLNQNLEDARQELARRESKFFQASLNPITFKENEERLKFLRNYIPLLEEAKRLQESGADPGFGPPAAAGDGLEEIRVTGQRREVDPKVIEAATKAAAARRKAIDNVITGLRDQAATEGATARQTALYQLAAQGATQADLERASALFDIIEAKQQEAATAAEQQRQALELQQSREDFVEQIRQELDPTRALRQELEFLRQTQEALIAQGSDLALSDEEYAAAQEKLKKQIEEASKGFQDMDQFGIQAARNIQTAFADFLFDPFDGGVKGMVRSFADAMRRMAAEALSSRILRALGLPLGGAGTGDEGGILAGIFHGGGKAGRASQYRSVSAMAFLGAPRFHSGSGRALGLAADEVPAILKRGERVLNVDETRDYERGGSARLAGILGLEEGLVMKHLESPGFGDLLLRKFSRDPGRFRSALGIG